MRKRRKMRVGKLKDPCFRQDNRGNWYAVSANRRKRNLPLLQDQRER
jgi:hypothetical protein